MKNRVPAGRGVDLDQSVGLAVKFDNRLGIDPMLLQALLEGLRLVIAPANQGLPAGWACIPFAHAMQFCAEAHSAMRAGDSAGHALANRRVGKLKMKSGVEFLVESPGLPDGTGKAIEHEP